jgi:acyl carrier protein
MHYQQVLDEVTALIRDHLPRPVPVEPGSEFKRDLDFDSIGVMDLVGAIEDHFDITIPLNELPRMQTVEQTARRIQEMVAARG